VEPYKGMLPLVHKRIYNYKKESKQILSFAEYVIQKRDTYINPFMVGHFSKETQSAQDLVQDFETGFHRLPEASQ